MGLKILFQATCGLECELATDPAADEKLLNLS